MLVLRRGLGGSAGGRLRSRWRTGSQVLAAVISYIVLGLGHTG